MARHARFWVPVLLFVSLASISLLDVSCASSAKNSAAPGDEIWIKRPDGALACEPGSGQSLKAGADELSRAGVRVVESRKTRDGKIRAMVCGIAAGTENAFRIRRADVPVAAKMGYVEVASEPVAIPERIK